MVQALGTGHARLPYETTATTQNPAPQWLPHPHIHRRPAVRSSPAGIIPGDFSAAASDTSGCGHASAAHSAALASPTAVKPELIFAGSRRTRHQAVEPRRLAWRRNIEVKLRCAGQCPQRLRRRPLRRPLHQHPGPGPRPEHQHPRLHQRPPDRRPTTTPQFAIGHRLSTIGHAPCATPSPTVGRHCPQRAAPTIFPFKVRGSRFEVQGSFLPPHQCPQRASGPPLPGFPSPIRLAALSRRRSGWERRQPCRAGARRRRA